MDKLIVKLCSGTLCYVMGGAELQLLAETLPEHLTDKVEIRGAPCLDCCNKPEMGKAPFVMVGQTIVASATVSNVIEEINKQLHGGNQ